MSPQSLERKEKRRKSLKRKRDDQLNRHKPKEKKSTKVIEDDIKDGSINLINEYYKGNLDE